VHHLVLTGGELIHGLRQRGEILLMGGELLDAFAQCCETLEHLLHLLLVERRGRGRFRGGRVWRNKRRRDCRYYLLCSRAVRLPSQRGNDTNTNCNQIAGEPS
jgi:hypothetical protein